MTEEQGAIQEIHPPLEIEESPSMSAEIAKIATALSKAQGEIEFAAKTTENTFFKSKYADLAEVWKAARKPLSENELAVVQLTQGGPVLVTIVTILTHSSGQWMRSEFTVKPVPKKDKETGEIREIGPQDLGSAITYGRRYAMAAIVGITQDDDDGNDASGKTTDAAAIIQKPARKSQASAKAQAATIPASDNTIAGIPEAYSIKSGEKNGKQWKKYSAKLDGEWYSTFSETDGETLNVAKESGLVVIVGYKEDKYGRTAENVTLDETMDANRPADPVTPVGQMADPNAEAEPPIGDEDIPF